jgi:hypothetical protein
MNWLDAARTMVALGALVGTAWRAWSVRHLAEEPPRLLVRVMVSVAVLTVALAATLGLSEASRGWDDAGTMVLGSAILFPPVLALLLLVIELIVWRMRPIRSGKWLAAAIVLFNLVIIVIPALMIALSGIAETGGAATGEGAEIGAASDGGGEAIGWWFIQIFAIICAGALAWWSHLPTVRRRLADVFA